MTEAKPNVIIDNGSFKMKSGYSGEELPREEFPSVLGKPKNKAAMVGAEQKEYYVGQEAEDKKGILSLSRPIKEGFIEDWEAVEHIWDYIFLHDLKCEPFEHNVLLTETLLNPKENRQKIAEIMMETFCVKGFYIAPDAALDPIAVGKFTGLACDFGHEGTRIAPIFDGYLLPHTTKKMNLGAKMLEKYFFDLCCTKSGIVFTTAAEIEIGRDLKEKLCYIALDIEKEKKNFQPETYEFPDGKIRSINEQIFMGPEVMFHPELNKWSDEGLANVCYKSITESPFDLRKELIANIILSGGNSMFRGLDQRLTKEITERAPEEYKDVLKVIAVPERTNLVWIGGSILSSISTFETNWITKQEYEAYGANIVHRKCF